MRCSACTPCRWNSDLASYTAVAGKSVLSFTALTDDHHDIIVANRQSIIRRAGAGRSKSSKARPVACGPAVLL